MKTESYLPAFRYLTILTISLLIITPNLYSQTTWTGTSGTAWTTPGNWSAGVPDAADDVTIPHVTNNPVISTSGISVKSVLIQSGGVLTISAAGVLNINGSSGDGMDNLGTVTNNGTINVGNTSGVGTNGIENEATFNNNSGAHINVDRVPITSYLAHVFNNYGTFTNAGTITAGVISGGGNGIYNYQGNFNNAAGVINISNTGTGVDLTYGTLTNSGIINIGPAGSATLTYGISSGYGTFTNSAGGQININRVSRAMALYTTFNNAGTVTIGAETAVANLFEPFSTATGPFNNNTGGIFKASGTIRSDVFVNAGGTLAPGNPVGKLTFNATENLSSSTISIDVNGTGTAGVNYDQVAVNGTATLGGTLALSINYAGVAGDQVTIMTAAAVNGTFSSVTGLAANWYVNYTPGSVILSYQPIPVNTWTGSVNTDWNNAGNWSGGIPDAADDVTIPNVTNDPVISNNAAVAKSVRVQSTGILTISAAGVLVVNGGSTFGLWNQGTVTNNGTIRGGNISSPGNFGIYNQGNFNNNSGSLIQVDRASTSGIALILGTMANAGTVNIGSLVPATNLMSGESGTFSNNVGGIVKGTGTIPGANFTNNGGTLSPGYSPGKMTFNAAETFTTNILAIEITGTGAAGITYDQLAVEGAATIGGTLNLSITYSPGIGDQFTIVSASSVTGTFTTVNGLPAGWNIVYYPGSVVVLYGLPASTWTGAAGTTAWNTAGNWSAGVPNAATDVTIPDVTNNPLISTSGISVKSVLVQAGGVLTISSAGVLNINGSSGDGMDNLGTVTNNGTINVGNTSGVGTNGIENQAIFNNNSGAHINVDRVPITSYLAHVFNNLGTFTNAGTITAGVISGGGNGVYNYQGNFNNAAGVINISNTSTGVDLTYGTLTNSGIINIGPAGSATLTYGINSGYGTFTNSAGGQININRVSRAMALYTTFNNAGKVTIGAETAVANLFEPFSTATGPFNNNTGGIFKASGTIRSDVFVNAGGALAPGNPIGKLTFNPAENLSNSTISLDINGVGTAGVNYDQVAVNGTVTLGGTLALSINYTGVQGNQVTLVSADAISGTFSSVTGLLPGWKITYTATSVLLTYDVNTTWTGAINSAWNTTGNWSNGVPTAVSMVLIPNVTNDPIISVAGAAAYSINLQNGAKLTVKTTGSLKIYGD
ncbi:MAG: hypothetical protein ABIN95_08980 [Mucilaginibacter sp.]